jgi:hypothetical protein
MAKLDVKVIDMLGGEVTKVAYEGAEYAKVSDNAQAGDIALITEDCYVGVEKGAFYELGHGHGVISIVDEDGDFRWGPLSDGKDWDLFRKTSAKTSPTLEERVDTLEKRVDAIKPELKVGDYARVIGETHCRDIGEGALVEIKEDLDDDGEYEIYPLDGSDYDYAKPASLEKLSDEEVAQAKAEDERKKLEEKWAEIGRKPNEFKKGDIVRVTKDTGGHIVGTIGELVAELSSKGYHRVYANGRTYSHSYELITPVEARFDRQ